MRHFFIHFCIFLFSLNGFCQSNEKLDKSKYKRVSEAYGYLIGQDYSLNIIKNKFPQLGPNIKIALMTFYSTFSNSKQGMKNYLLGYLSESEFNMYEESTKAEINKSLSDQTFTEKSAKAFISEVESRAKGNIISPVLETLLSFQYSNQPSQEFLEGFTNTFKTIGHSKSKNTDWQIEVPISWKPSEGERPNIIQTFTSDFGDGSQMIILLVKEMSLPEDYSFTKNELNEIFTEKEIRNMIPQGAVFISFTKMTFDNNQGGMLEFEQSVSRLDINIKVRMVQFMFIRKNKMYILQGTVSSEMIDLDLGLDMKKYLPLYKLVANSIVVNDQYK